MRRISWFVTLLMLVPQISLALQLHWAGGASDLTVSQDTQAILVVQADSVEATLPDSWRLQWTADSLGVQFSAFDRYQACLVDTAKVDSIAPPSTPADSVANQVTAYFCSSGSTNAATAYFLVALPAGGRGRMKVVALDPADTTQVIESNEVTFNGGIDAAYAPTILRMTSDHSTTTLRVAVIGADLSGIQGVRISAPELQVDVPLTLETRTSSTSVTGSAALPIPLPSSAVLIETPQGIVSFGEVPADVVAAAEVPDDAYYRDPAYPGAYPKDFAFIDAPTPIGGVWRNLFHIFYIRHLTTPGLADSLNEITLGHAWSRDLMNWEYTSNSLDAFHANTGNLAAWDHLHVWAPSIVLFGTKFYMFYTGVADNGDQTIGYATGDSIYTTSPGSSWSRQGAYTLSPLQAHNQWASQFHLWNFRDPSVMPDPQDPSSRLLMFYTAKTSADTAHYAVGVARSFPNDASQWTDIGFYPTTDYTHTLIGRLESPTVFPDSANQAPGQDFAATWRVMFTAGDWDFPDSTRIVFFDSKVTGTDVTDLTASHWSTTPTNLYDYLHLTSASPEYGHQATEMLNLNGTYFWAAFDGTDIRFRRVRWGGDNQGINQFWLENVGQIAGVAGLGTPKTPRLVVAGMSPSHGATRFRIDMPARMRTSLAVYDVMGRKVRSLIDNEMTPGSSQVTWDGRNQAGARVGTGMYFARMVAGGTSHVVRVPLVR